MKKLLLSLLFALLAVQATTGKEVSAKQAQQYAQAYMQARGIKSNGISSVFPSGETGKAYYIINLAPQGWAIVSADDTAQPILAYSESGSLDLNLLPPAMRHALLEYEQQISRIAQRIDTPHSRWTSASGNSTRAAGRPIDPLIKVNWNQSAPYNAYCPKQEALVGCVAVAMSQAMSVQRHPSRPKGSISYTAPNYGGLSINFDNELAYNWDDIISGANNLNETARLLYHAGMSVRMDYGTDGSGIPSNEVYRISDALKVNFSYPQTVTYYWRDYYTGDWEQLILNELNAGRAVIYNAVDSQRRAGHSFNVDGYDGDGHFHINWGWGGYGNGNFSINSLRDAAMSMDYDANHVMVTGIGGPDQVLKSISLSHNRIEENLPTGSIVGAVYVNGEVAKSTYEVNVHGTYDSKLGGYKDVPFRYEDGMLKTTEPLSASTAQWNVEITVTDRDSGSELTQGFRIQVDPWQSLGQTTTLKYERATGVFQLSTKHNVTYTLKDAGGRTLQEGALSPLPELTFNSSILPAGENILQLKCVDEVKNITIKK